MFVSVGSPALAGSFWVRTFIKHSQSIFKVKPALKFESIRSTKSITALSSIATDANPHFRTLKPDQQHQIQLYVNSLLEWNQKMNLTAVKEEDEVMERHVEDSLAMLRPIHDAYVTHCEGCFEDLNVVDVGTGGGLPGLILAIACPGWKVTLLESMNKRCVFLEHVVGLVGLQNVRVICDRAENLGRNPEFRERFDIAIARAVAEMRVLAEYCLPLVNIGGLFVAAKGHDPQEEVIRAERAIKLMGASLLQTCFVESHSKYGQRTAIVCRKDHPTPRKYPRSPGTPSKLPL